MFKATIKSMDSKFDKVITGDYDTVFMKAYNYIREIWATINAVDITQCFNTNQVELWADDGFGNEFIHTNFTVVKVED